MGLSAESMRLLGDKIMCNEFAERCGVPVIPYTKNKSAFEGLKKNKNVMVK